MQCAGTSNAPQDTSARPGPHSCSFSHRYGRGFQAGRRTSIYTIRTLVHLLARTRPGRMRVLSWREYGARGAEVRNCAPSAAGAAGGAPGPVPHGPVEGTLGRIEPVVVCFDSVLTGDVGFLLRGLGLGGD